MHNYSIDKLKQWYERAKRRYPTLETATEEKLTEFLNPFVQRGAKSVAIYPALKYFSIKNVKLFVFSSPHLGVAKRLGVVGQMTYKEAIEIVDKIFADYFKTGKVVLPEIELPREVKRWRKGSDPKDEEYVKNFIPTPGKRDTRTLGKNLYLLVQPTGTKSYMMQLQVPGSRFKHYAYVLGETKDISLQTAREEVEKLREAIKNRQPYSFRGRKRIDTAEIADREIKRSTKHSKPQGELKDEAFVQSVKGRNHCYSVSLGGGLRLVVRRDGSKSYAICFTYDRQQVFYALNTTDAMSLEQARAEVDKVRLAAQSGGIYKFDDQHEVDFSVYPCKHTRR